MGFSIEDLELCGPIGAEKGLVTGLVVRLIVGFLLGFWGSWQWGHEMMISNGDG